MVVVAWSRDMTQDPRWIGPYVSKGRDPLVETVRHADDITLKHIVELRKRVNDLERYLNNFEVHYMKIRRTLTDVRQIIRQSEDPSSEVLRVIDEALKGL